MIIYPQNNLKKKQQPGSLRDKDNQQYKKTTDEVLSSTDHSDRYSNLFLNAYINRHVHADYLEMI